MRTASAPVTLRSQATARIRRHARRHESRRLRVSPADRSDERAPPQTRRGARAGVRARQRDVGEHELFRGLGSAAAKPPAGFSGVLSREQWKGVVDFANAVDAQIVTSFATSPGTRDSAGVWTPEQARRFVTYTRSVGGSIAAAEFMNEPTFAAMGGAPAGYDAAAYGRDFKVFHAFVKQGCPGHARSSGPGSVGETTGDWGVAYGMAAMLNTRDLLAACAARACRCVLLPSLRRQLAALRRHGHAGNDRRRGALRAVAGAH